MEAGTCCSSNPFDMSSLLATESQHLKGAVFITPQSANHGSEKNSGALVLSDDAKGTEGRVVDATLNVDAEMASSQSERALAPANAKIAWGYGMDDNGMLVEQADLVVFEFEDDVLGEFREDYLNEMPWVKSQWSMMTVIFKPDPGQVRDGASSDRDDVRDWLKGQVGY